MILKDDAIVLRIYPFGNTSRSVVWLTRQHGKIVTLAKGSQRPGSALLGQFDLFYTCEVLFYAREQRQVHILKEAPVSYTHLDVYKRQELAWTRRGLYQMPSPASTSRRPWML